MRPPSAGPSRAADEMMALSQAADARRREGRIEEAQALVEQALRWASVLPSVDAACALWCDQADLLMAWMHGIADDADPSAPAQREYLREQARACCLEAASLAARASDPQWEVQLLLRASDLLDQLGEHADAIALQCRALRLIVPTDDGRDAPAPEAWADRPGPA